VARGHHLNFYFRSSPDPGHGVVVPKVPVVRLLLTTGRLLGNSIVGTTELCGRTKRELRTAAALETRNASEVPTS